MPSIRLKKILHWTGTTLGVLGVIFVAFKLMDYGEQIDFSRFTYLSLLALLGLTMIYAAANILLALAWKALLHHLGIKANFIWTVRTYGVSQLAKYIPGNIFHLAGRQAIGGAAGLPTWPVAKSTVWELGLISFSGILFSALVVPLYLNQSSVWSSSILFFVIVGGSVWVLSRRLGPWIVHGLACYVVFLALSGLIFFGVLCLVVPSISKIQPLLTGITGAYVVAWLAGLVTPGAPAGVGVREVVLFSVLHTVVSELDLLTAIVLGRIITVGGDVFFFLATLPLKVEFSPCKESMD